MIFTEDNVEFQSQSDFNKMETDPLYENNNENNENSNQKSLKTDSAPVSTVIRKLSLKLNEK